MTWQTQLDWLLTLARYEVNGVYPWRPYVKGRCLELEADGSGLWDGLWEALQRELEV